MSQPFLRDDELTEEQRRIAQRIVTDRPQLVRGVAGSGKTLTLSRNLAHRLAQLDAKPTARSTRIAVLCFNRCLVPLLFERTAEAYFQLTKRTLDRNRVLFSHMNGFLFRLSKHPTAIGEGWGGPIRYLNVERKGFDVDLRSRRYLEQIESIPVADLEPVLFDTIYVDEGQDFTETELKLILRLMRPSSDTNEKNLIVFYDNAQNLYARKAPTWIDLGLQVVGRSDVMKQCKRNTAEVLDLALNVLVGSCGPEHSRAGTRKFADLDTLRRDDLIDETGDLIHTKFATRSGPAPIVGSFERESDEQRWVTGYIDQILADGVPPEEVLVIAKDRRYVDRMAYAIQRDSKWVQHIAMPHSDLEKDLIARRPGHITITTPESAKGYDSQVVFVVGTEQFTNEPKNRASFYVASTRAKNQLFVSGVGQNGLLPEAIAVFTQRFPDATRPGSLIAVSPRPAPTPEEMLALQVEELTARLKQSDEEATLLREMLRDEENRNGELARQLRESQVVRDDNRHDGVEVNKLRQAVAELEKLTTEAMEESKEKGIEVEKLLRKLRGAEVELQRSEEEKKEMIESQAPELVLALDTLLPNLEILPSSLDQLTRPGVDPRFAMEMLGQLNADVNLVAPRTYPVRSDTRWIEVKFSTGTSDEGRLYYAKTPDAHGKRKVFLSRKQRQTHDLAMLKKLDQ